MSERADKVYQKLDEAAAKHIAGGGTIVSGIFSHRNGGVCPIAALTGVNDTASYHLPLNKAVDDDLTGLEFNAIIAGVDGYESNKLYPSDFYEVGTKLRSKYIK